MANYLKLFIITTHIKNTTDIVYIYQWRSNLIFGLVVLKRGSFYTTAAPKPYTAVGNGDPVLQVLVVAL